MFAVDPSGLASAAQRITAALSEVSAANPEHPPLAADSASVGAATRLTTAGSTLASVLAEQAAGLATTAEQLVNIASGFTAKDSANAAKITSLDTGSDGASVSGWAPSSPPVPPDARPILVPPPPGPAEAISQAVHSGAGSGNEAFIAGWRQVAGSTRDASAVVRLIADNLPDSWESPVATEKVRSHLIGYADALETSGQRADTMADQANRHAQEVTQARRDIPSPDEFAAMNHRLQTLAQANIQTGGRFAVPLANAWEEKAQMEGRTAQGFGGYYTATEATTSGEIDLDGDGIPDVPADDAAAAVGEGTGLADEAAEAGLPGSPDMAGQLASMLPSMIPTVMGAAGGLLGGVVSSMLKGPESLIQAGTQAVGAATQGLSGLTQPNLDDVGGEDLGLDDAPFDEMSGLGGGAGATSPAAGGAPSLPPVTPSTGPNPTPPTLPAGGSLPPPVTPSAGPGGAGYMPMGMPLAGLAGAGGQGGANEERKGKPKQVVARDIPHTESVTGKVTEDRIAVSATAPKEQADDPPPGNDDPPPRSEGAPLIRRITTVGPKDGS
ncbi:PPE domain-containing protein [Mycobacterium lehmannii]|uniref:PPE domain-containing protein n=1 Tax=Mycobacterium lehmannii TaxID=2048550 RepID=UPI000B93E731|nr:PPE domain-containing protein [Mycobacterium lehmannii]